MTPDAEAGPGAGPGGDYMDDLIGSLTAAERHGLPSSGRRHRARGPVPWR